MEGMDHMIQSWPELNPEQEKQVRAIIQEEIVKAFQAFRRETEGYDGGEIKDMASDMLNAVLDGTVLRLTCPHEKYQDWGYGPQPQCARCGEPEPMPENPFEGPCNHTYDLSVSRECLLCGTPHPTKEG